MSIAPSAESNGILQTPHHPCMANTMPDTWMILLENRPSIWDVVEACLKTMGQSTKHGAHRLFGRHQQNRS